MKHIEHAAWATKQEVDLLYEYFRNSRKNKDSLTNEWLVTNGDWFISKHNTFIDDWINYKLNEHNTRYYDRVRKYNSLISARCVCKGDLRKVKMQDYEFIGCENYKEQGYNHIREYKPREPIFEEPEISTMYLYHFKKLHNLPKELKESVLYEYLLMNGIEPYVDLSSKYTISKDASAKSKKRELINKGLLERKFERLLYQKVLKVKYYGEKEKYKIVDFIGINSNKCIIFEQKKNVDLINEDQVHEYVNILKWISNKSNKTFTFDYFFVIEQGEPNHENKILTLQSLITYEFN
jgi:ssDNA-binding Zn-finger/Zn-ribbon topoisomerase 1